MRIMTRDRHIDLYRHAEFLQVTQSTNRSIKRTRNSTERVVSPRVGSIEADGYPADARIHNHARTIFCDQCTVRGEGNTEASIRGVASQLENVGTVQRFTAAQYQNWIRRR